MALIACPECEKEVSDKAESCPHCGYPLAPSRVEKLPPLARRTKVLVLADAKPDGDATQPKEASRKKERRPIGCGALLMLLVVIGVWMWALDSNSPAPSRSPTLLSTPPKTSPASPIAKRDGTIDPRHNDLDELCKDWVYYRTKILKYTREGDLQAAAKARAAFADINRWLNQYRDEDVSSTCAKYDTPEFIRRYM